LHLGIFDQPVKNDFFSKLFVEAESRFKNETACHRVIATDHRERGNLGLSSLLLDCFGSLAMTIR